MRIAADDLRDPQVLALVREHVAIARGNTPPGFAWALDDDALRGPGYRLFAAWEGDALMGIAALHELGGRQAEVKSMRTVGAFLRRGVGRALLRHLIGLARGEGVVRLFLETGATEPYAAARTLYEAEGFRRCGRYGDYPDSDFTCFYTLEL